MRYTIKLTIELDVTVIAYLSPAVAPTICMDPNDSDPGDPGEQSIGAVMLEKEGLPGLNIMPYLSYEDLDHLAQQAFEDLEDRSFS